MKVNGNYGLEKELKLDSWRLQVVGVDQAKKLQAVCAGCDDVGVQVHGCAAKQAEEASPKINPAVREGDGGGCGGTGHDQPLRGQDEAGLSDSTLRPGTAGLLLTLDDLKKLPRHELVTQFKCIEGWSQIAHWGGYRLADLMADVSAGEEQGRQAAEVCVHGDSGWELLLRLRPDSLRPPAGAAGDGDARASR